MRALLGVSVLWIGCSSPGPADAPCGDDRDGDRVCDSVDVCPDVADPLQFDSDGDGLGWACDPVESFTFDTVAPALFPVGSVSSAKLVVKAGPNCDLSGPCEEIVVAGDQQTTWTVGVSSIGPVGSSTTISRIEDVLITADDQLLVSRRIYNEGDTYALDPASKTFSARGPMLGRTLRAGRGAPVLLTLLPTSADGPHLVEPRNGTEFVSIASTTNGGWFTLQTSPDEDTWATEDEPLVAVFAASATPWSLKRFVPGTDALAELSPPVTAAKEVAQLRLGRGAPWCVLQGATASLFVPTASGIRVTPLPLTSCAVQSYTFPGTELLIGFSTDVNSDGVTGWTAVFVRDGVAREVFADFVPTTQTFRVLGRDVIVIEAHPSQPNQPSSVWVIWPDNSVSLVANDLAGVDISIGTDTVHVIGVKTGGSTKGPLTVRRLQRGQAVQSAELIADVSSGFEVHVVTSAEGAAIASTSGYGWIAPSSTFTFTTYPSLSRVIGGVRRDHTILLSGVLPDALSGQNTGAPFAYDEVSGQPRLTRLRNDTTYFQGVLVDILGTQPSEYFGISPGCAFGRIRVDGTGTPYLESSNCGFTIMSFSTLKVVAVTRQGETVVADTLVPPGGLRLTALSESGVRVIANGARVTPILDRSTNPPTLVAWVSQDNFEAYACVEEMPLRCWAVASQMALLDSRIEGSSPEIVSMLLYAADGTRNHFTVVRTIGPGNATLP